MTACIWVCCSPIEGAIIEDRPTSGVFGVKAGIIAGTETRGEFRVTTDWDKSFGVFGEVPFWRPVFVQFAFDFHSFRQNRLDNWMIDANIGIKPHFRLRRHRMDIKPGVAFGYGSIGEYASALGDTDYFTLRLFVEGDFEIDRKKALLVEFSVLYATGGNNNLDLHIKPTMMLRFGIGLR
ncbi:hypothetical protein GF377_06635 [candidate division GN15 bacterium]|nr:hypothetical protein [candidate division GN15 bacterium]